MSDDGQVFFASASGLAARLPLPATEQWRDGTWDIAAFARTGLSVIYFAPRGEDHQRPHEQDEIYFVICGTACLQLDGDPRPLVVGDMAFVPAYMPHHFTDISNDFAAWAVFFGRGL